MIFHGLQQGLDSLPAIVVFTSGGERVGFIDKQHAPYSRADHFLCFDGGLSYISGNQSGSVCFDQLAFFQRSDGGIQLPHKTGHSSLAGTGIAHEDHMHGHRGNRELVVGSKLANLDEIDQALDVLFDVLQTDERVQLLQQFFLCGERLLFLFGIGLSFRLGRTLLGILRALCAGIFQETGCRGSDKIKRIQTAGRTGDVVRIAQSRELVRDFCNGLCLRVGDVIITGGQI